MRRGGPIGAAPPPLPNVRGVTPWATADRRRGLRYATPPRRRRPESAGVQTGGPVPLPTPVESTRAQVVLPADVGRGPSRAPCTDPAPGRNVTAWEARPAGASRSDGVRPRGAGGGSC